MKTHLQRYNIAHRGARSLAPENTMLAFYKAWQVGAHGVETDISVTADGRLILFHDVTLRRTTNVAQIFPRRANKPVHTFSLQDIGQLDAGSWFVEQDPFAALAGGAVTTEELQSMYSVPVPLLEELLLFVKKKSWFILIEIKRLPEEIASFGIVEEVLRLIDMVGLDPALFSISSFEHSYLQRVQELRPEVEVNALIGENITTPQHWGEYRFEVYNANIDLIDSLQIEEARRHGCRINLYTVNRLAEMKHYLAHGIDMIITDYPQLLAGT
jgi:glycerophosphoryl diester phosphodiesterase